MYPRVMTETRFHRRLPAARCFGIEAQVIGHVEPAPAKEVVLTSAHGTFTYH